MSHLSRLTLAFSDAVGDLKWASDRGADWPLEVRVSLDSLCSAVAEADKAAGDFDCTRSHTLISYRKVDPFHEAIKSVLWRTQPISLENTHAHSSWCEA